MSGIAFVRGRGAPPVLYMRPATGPMRMAAVRFGTKMRPWERATEDVIRVMEVPMPVAAETMAQNLPAWGAG